MQKFYYNTINKLRITQAALNLVTVKYTCRDFDTDNALIQFLGTASVVYKEIGNKDRESQLLALKAEFFTAQRGINPITFEKVTIRRYEMVNTICFKIVQAIEQFMRADLLLATQTLDAAKETVTQIIIAGLQAGIITDTLIADLKTQQKIEALWKLLATDANIALGQKRVLLQVSKYDVWFLMDELITGLKK